jgi:hypothetical protein
VSQAVSSPSNYMTFKDYLAYDDGTIARDMPPPALEIEVVSPGQAGGTSNPC